MSVKIVPAPGVMSDGSIGVRGHRALCERCGYMSNVVGYKTAGRYAARHRKGECNGSR